MLIEEVYINQTKGYRFGESGLFEPFTDDLGKLFKYLQREYGRCTSKIYVDADGPARQVGWVFEKKMTYEDARDPKDTYIREVWVTLHDDKPTVKTTNHYHFLD